MNPDQLEKCYRELPAHHRDRWSFGEFRALAGGRQTMDLPFESVREANARAADKLPPLQKNEFGGLASAFGVQIDTWIPSYIEPGAFKNTLGNEKERSRVKVLFQHSAPIGVPTFLQEVDEGLLVVGKVSETSLGQDVLTLMRDKVVTEMSIGFDPTEFVFRENQEKELCRHITQCRLWEFSPVSFGANSGAKITVVNSLAGSAPALDMDELAQKVAERLHALLHPRETPPPLISVDHSSALAELEKLALLAQ